ncbi:MAG: ribonuclease E/G [Kiloniellales bacterium]|nr:ribonuclease E/G [Kiloniellales bacterium]
MSYRLLIEAQPGETCALLIDADTGEPLDVYYDPPKDGRVPEFEDVFLGRIKKVDKTAGSAFVDIGNSLAPAFLPLSEAPERITEGRIIPVKVVRIQTATKGAKVTAALSKKLRASLSPSDLSGEPRLIRAATSGLEALLELAPREVIVDGLKMFLDLKNRQANRQPLDSITLIPYQALTPLWDSQGFRDLLRSLCKGEVALPSGGRLLIEPGETLTSVDVDSASHRGGGSRSAEIKAINLEAVTVLSRQMRLRALSGRILVDLLQMDRQADRKAVETALAEACRKDPEALRIWPIYRSALLEISRRRSKPPIHEALMKPVGSLGRSWVWRPEFCAFEAIRAVRREASLNPAARFEIACPPECHAILSQGCAAEAFDGVQDRLGHRVRSVEQEDLTNFEIRQIG